MPSLYRTSLREVDIGQILVHHSKASKFTPTPIADGVKVIIWRAEGGFVLSTSEGGLFVYLTVFDLCRKVAELFGFNENGEMLVREIVAVKKRNDKNIPCPYCGSQNTCGHGTRWTQKEIQKRRLCYCCLKTYISEKKSVIVQAVSGSNPTTQLH